MFVFSGAKLRALREALDMPRERLALDVGVGYPTVSQWEMGLRSPRRSNLLRLASVLGCAPADLLDPDPDLEAVAQ